MAVYVDDMSLPATVPNGGNAVRGRWSHLFAGTHDELMRMAETIGLNPRWIQHEGTPGEHFDVVMSKRAAAIRAGARPVTWREAGEYFAARECAAREAQYRCEDVGCTEPPGGDWPTCPERGMSATRTAEQRPREKTSGHQPERPA